MANATPALPPLNLDWRSQFGSILDGQRVRPRELFGSLQNPHRGTATFQRFNGDPVELGSTWSDGYGPEQFPPPPELLTNYHYPDTTIAYCRWVWDIFEPRPGARRWELVDGALRAASERGQTLAIRIQQYAGGSRMPDWLPPELSKVNDAGKYIPEHNSPHYLKHWGDLIRTFGERYDGHPALESFDVAYGGPCGETGGNATPETAAALVDIYMKAFPKTQLLTMLGTPGSIHAQMVGNGRFGWRADCFGDLRDGKPNDGVHIPRHLRWNHMHDYYPMKVAKTGVADAWKTAPIVMETCWTVSHWFNSGFNIDWILQQGLAYHTSIFMPKSSYIPAEIRDKIDAFNNQLGYRFVLRQMHLPLEVKRNTPMKTTYFFDNVGVAPIYRDYVLALRFRQDEDHLAVVPLDTNLRKWLPGQTWFEQDVTIPPGLAPGVVGIDMAIIDPVSKKPAVKLAIENRLPDGWHPLTHIDLLE
jgi:hypothetical protein